MRAPISDRASYLVELCRGKRVLHIGCADDPFTDAKLKDGTLLHQLISDVASRCCGVDSSVSAIETLKRNGFSDVMNGSIETLVRSGAVNGDDFDIVLAAEVLEHVQNAGSFLCSLRPLLKGVDARLVVTTPNAYCAYRWTYTMLTGREGGHPDHVAQYSANTLTQLLKRCGYETQSIRFYSGMEYLQNRGRERLLWWIDKIAFKFRPQLGDGLMVCCRSVDADESVSDVRAEPATST